MDCLNSSRSSARSMEGSLAPISSMLYLARMPRCGGGIGWEGRRQLGLVGWWWSESADMVMVRDAGCGYRTGGGTAWARGGGALLCWGVACAGSRRTNAAGGKRDGPIVEEEGFSRVFGWEVSEESADGSETACEGKLGKPVHWARSSACSPC